MGGIGSGRRAAGRPTVEDCLRLDLKRLNALGFFRPGCPVSGEVECASANGHRRRIAVACTVSPPSRSVLVIGLLVGGKRRTQRIELEPVPMRYGGVRWYAMCPIRDTRCTTLLLPPGAAGFASNQAWRLPYASQREGPVARAGRRMDKAARELNAMSKCARGPARERQLDRWFEAFALCRDRLAQSLGFG